MDTLQFTYQNELGREGIDTDPATPLARASRRTLEDGHPSRRYALALVDPIESEGFSNDVRWIGSFTHSIGGRLLCFLSYSGSSAGSIPDHITLDKGYSNIHFTYGDGNRKSVGRPHRLENGMYHWFALGIQDFSVLRALYKETQITVPVPVTDATRRMNIVKEAQNPGYSDICVKLDPIAKKRFSPGFLYLSINVGAPGLPPCTYVPTPAGAPIVPPLERDNIRNLMCRTHKLCLSSDYELHISSTWLPGSLPDHFLVVAHQT
jgi:hypothetical protein